MNDDTYLRSEVFSASDGTQVTYRRRRLLGPSPRSSQSRRLPRRFEEQTLYLCLSPLLGEGLQGSLFQLPRTSAILCLEYEPPLQPLWKNGPKEVTEHPDVEFAASADEADALAARFIAPRGVRRVETISLSGAARLHFDEYRHAEARTGRYIHQFWKNRGTEVRLGRRWIANVWRNIALPSRSWDEIVFLTRRRRKAVIAGAGPSLDRHGDMIRRVTASVRGGDEERPLLVALDTALPSLAARDIPVDIVIAMDGQLANAADLVPYRWNDATLLADATVHPTIPRMFPSARRFFFVTRFTDNSLFAKRPSHPVSFAPAPWIPVVPPRGSIAPTAVEVLSRFAGFKDIVTVGIDFHYRPPKTHACMSAPHRRFLRSHSRRTGTDGFAGSLLRPWRDAALATGAPAIVDGILADQANQFGNIVQHVSRTGARVRSLSGDRIDIGTSSISEEEFLDWGGEKPIDREAASETGADAPSERFAAASLESAYNRLVAQETILADTTRGAFLDAELTWAWFDIPQWPIVARRRDWVELHRDRLLRGVRDHRRRIERVIHAAGTDGPIGS